MARLLVIEDDEDLREMLTMTLEDVGYTVFPAGGGREAVDLARQHPLDLAIADVRMKDMDGLAALKNIRVFVPDLRSIIMTGYADTTAPLRALELYASDYLYKPFSVKDFLAVVERVLRADEEREKGFGLLRGLLAGVRSLAGKVHETSVQRQLKAIEAIRQRCYDQFYLSVRSKKLLVRDAWMVWDQLERAERAREALKEGPADPGNAFQRALEMLAFYCRSPGAQVTLEKPALDLAQFQEFYRRVQSGLLPGHELPLASKVRLLTPFEIRQSDQLMTLYTRFWWSAKA
ncbi:MAG: response regulator [Vulcanimicrobiota bacterium]